MKFEYHVEGGNFTLAGQTASRVKKTLKQLNISGEIIKRTVVALYEAEVNVVAHAYHGIITVELGPDYILINVDDTGPGIPDIQQAMEIGFSTASPEVREMGFGAGMGLSNIKNNSDNLEITSQVGKGTCVRIFNRIASIP